MTSKRPPTTESELVRAVGELFKQVEPGPEDTDEILREAGLDPAAVRAKMAEVARRAIDNSPFNWRYQGEALEQDRSRLARSKTDHPTTIAGVIAAIERLINLGGGPAQQFVSAHRNFKEQTYEDLVSLLEELEHLTGQQGTNSDQG